MACAHIYVRCSHLDSAESGFGLADQEQQCRMYFDLLRMRDPNLRDLRLNPVIFRDLAISAYQKKSAAFDKRPAGGKLLEVVKPGDHILFARLDRSFRNALEARLWMDHWRQAGVRIHFIDLQIDVGTATGMMLFGIMSYVAEWYSGTISERTKEGLAQKKLRDGAIRPGQMIGEKLVTLEDGSARVEKDRKRLVRMRWIRWVYGCINDKRSAMGLKRYTSDEIAFMYERLSARREGREPYKVISRMALIPKTIRKDFHRAALIWPDRYRSTPTNSG